ncbi:hypothetical protein Bbelb_412780 [Branchiostoma belcheri]|nr:hypothetical protein Bbelb_412780 [Branchiostoma belcheri]
MVNAARVRLRRENEDKVADRRLAGPLEDSCIPGSPQGKPLLTIRHRQGHCLFVFPDRRLRKQELYFVSENPPTKTNENQCPPALKDTTSCTETPPARNPRENLTRTSVAWPCPAFAPYSVSCSPLIYHGVSDGEPPCPGPGLPVIPPQTRAHESRVMKRETKYTVYFLGERGVSGCQTLQATRPECRPENGAD